MKNIILPAALLIFILTISCQTENKEIKPKRLIDSIPFTPFFDLEKIKSDDHVSATPSFKLNTVDSFFYQTKLNIDVRLQPFSVDERLMLKSVHTYPENCRTDMEDQYRYADIMFPNKCKYEGKMLEAKLVLRNKNKEAKKIYARVFYQNVTYFHPISTMDEINSNLHLDNHYGCSGVLEHTIAGGDIDTILIGYQMILDVKNYIGNEYQKYKEPLRAGNYEFIALIGEKKEDLLQENIFFNGVNPIAEIKKDELTKNRNGEAFGNIAYVRPEHFKFVILDEKFDGKNSLAINHIYQVKHKVEKELYPGFNYHYRDVISESWTDYDFFKGFISKAPKKWAEYGNRKENVNIDKDGIYLKIPGSTPEKKQKTWGEVLFGPSFKYGKIQVCAKLALMRNKTKSPNGIIHNLWLYQRDWIDEKPDPNSPYKNLTNNKGTQPYEIDLEFWTNLRTGSETWDDIFFINYSIVDYMKNDKVKLKPQEIGNFENKEVNRSNPVHLSVPVKFGSSFLNDYHVYEIEWKPTEVRFSIDGKFVCRITDEYAKIPDKHMYLWIGSPIYQDGTFYDQRQIPFLESDKFSHIKWIKIE
jgi:beta-glucanase (GH16 family)